MHPDTLFCTTQAQALKTHIGSRPEIKPEVVIVSPLTRALETAVGVFGGNEWLESNSNVAQPLMLSQDGVHVSPQLECSTHACHAFQL